MIKLRSPVSGDDVECVEQCFAEVWAEAQHSLETTRRQLEPHKDMWRERFEKYFAGKGAPSVTGPSPFPRRAKKEDEKEVGDLMFERYKSGGGTDDAIVAWALKVAARYCPYCGMYLRRKPANRNPDRDHLRPRSLFPEFSLLRVNLVVACDDCNEAKSSKDVDEKGRWLFVHPYFDEFLGSRLISASVQAAGTAPVPEFRLSEDLDEDEAERVRRHVDTLDLFQRYADEPLTNAVRLLEAHREHFLGGRATVEDVRQGLKTQGEREVADRPNDPLGALLLGLAESPDLEALLEAT